MFRRPRLKTRPYKRRRRGGPVVRWFRKLQGLSGWVR